ncbi:MAG: hypothetical protein R3272_14230 [Candidatus Promineifilaceae bacterium]|nr:hypothetical protein [Candidatus Promineifilaceae bacterium]
MKSTLRFLSLALLILTVGLGLFLFAGAAPAGAQTATRIPVHCYDARVESNAEDTLRCYRMDDVFGTFTEVASGHYLHVTHLNAAPQNGGSLTLPVGPLYAFVENQEDKTQFYHMVSDGAENVSLTFTQPAIIVHGGSTVSTQPSSITATNYSAYPVVVVALGFLSTEVEDPTILSGSTTSSVLQQTPTWQVVLLALLTLLSGAAYWKGSRAA